MSSGFATPANSPASRAETRQADTPDARAPLSAWYALGVLVLTTIFAYTDRQVLSLVMPSLQKSLSLSDLKIGALQGLGLALFAGVATYPIGWLADRYGRRPMLVVSILIWAISTGACAFQSSFEGLLSATIGIAIGEAGVVPIVFALIPDLFVGRQRFWANIIYFGAGIAGGAVGVALGGAVLHWLTVHHEAVPAAVASLDPWRITMVAVALPAPVFMALVAAIRLPKKIGVMLPDTISEVPKLSFLRFIHDHWKTFACLFGAILGYCLPMAAFGWLPVVLFRIFGLPPEAVGVKMGSVLGIAAIAGTLLPAAATRLWRPHATGAAFGMARIFVIIGLVPMILLPFATVAWQVYFALGTMFTLCTATAALMPGAIQDVSPLHLRSRIMALVTIVLAVSQVPSSILVGAISAAIPSPHGILIALSIVGITGFLLSSVLFSVVVRPFAATVREVQP